jgi:hypothetical protein
MAVYVVGLLLLTGAIELTLALFLAVQGKVPAPSSDFWVVYLFIDIGLIAAGGILVQRGLASLRAPARPAPDAPDSANPPNP